MMDAKNQRNSVLADALFERNCCGVHGQNIDGAGRHAPHRARSRSNVRLQAAMALRPMIGRHSTENSDAGHQQRDLAM